MSTFEGTLLLPPPPSLPARPPGPFLPPRPAPTVLPGEMGTASSSPSDIAQPTTDRVSLYRAPHVRSPFRPAQRSPRRQPHRAAGMYAGLAGQVDQRTLDDLPVYAPAAITDVLLAGGYKWITGWSDRDDGCNIAVPGLPDVWRGDERAVKQLRHDAELEGNIEFADYNGASTPRGTSPHETVFLSLIGPEVLKGVQVITARNNLKKLLVSCSRNLQLSKSTRDPRKRDEYLWRIEAWVVPGSDLVLLDRWEPPVRRRPREANSFHLAYHEATTAKLQVGSDRTPGCQRLISYTFGGIKMIVKCDIDAALPWDVDQSDSGSTTHTEEDAMSDISMTTVVPGEEESSVFGHTESTLDGHTNQTDRSMITSLEVIARLSDSTLGGGIFHQTSTGIRVHHEPLFHPPHENLLSIKTRQWREGQSLQDVNHLDNIFANIFWAQVPTLMIGWHNQGDFSVAPPSRFHIGENPLKHIEDQHRPAISKARALLGWVLGLARQHGRVAFICDGDTVEAHKLGTKPAELSEEARAIMREAGLIRS